MDSRKQGVIDLLERSRQPQMELVRIATHLEILGATELADKLRAIEAQLDQLHYETH
jgi:hypothetical protein